MALVTPESLAAGRCQDCREEGRISDFERLALLIAQSFDPECADATWSDIWESFDPWDAVREAKDRLLSADSRCAAAQAELASVTAILRAALGSETEDATAAGLAEALATWREQTAEERAKAELEIKDAHGALDDANAPNGPESADVPTRVALLAKDTQEMADVLGAILDRAFPNREPDDAFEAQEIVDALTSEAEGANVLNRAALKTALARVAELETSYRDAMKTIGGCEGSGSWVTSSLDLDGNPVEKQCECLACHPAAVLGEHRTVIDYVRVLTERVAELEEAVEAALSHAGNCLCCRRWYEDSSDAATRSTAQHDEDCFIYLGRAALSKGR